MIRGGERPCFTREDDLAAAYSALPQARRAKDEREILEDGAVKLVVSAAVASERAPLGIRVMKHGKDFMADKPGITTLEQLAEVRKVQAETKRIYSICYSERLENRATVKAGELVKAGAIGDVVQTIGLGPHRLNANTRPAWFFERAKYGGILCDIASHQFDQFLFFTGSTKAEVVASQVGNTHHPQYPELEDFGDVMLRGDRGAGYIRVDWFTRRARPGATAGSRSARTGSSRSARASTSAALGRVAPTSSWTEGGPLRGCADTFELRSAARDGVINRTETAMPQAHCFRAMELRSSPKQAAG